MRFKARRMALLLTVVVVMSLATAWAYAQAPFGNRAVTPTVLSGPDVGFRVEAQRAGTPVGRIVVRINGQWVEAEFGSSVRQLTAK